MSHKVVIEDPEKPKSSLQAKAAAKLRSKSNDQTTRPAPSDIWDPSSWQSKPIVQDVVYDDETAVCAALAKIESLPPLVHPNEIERLKQQLKEAALGQRFVLQGGDCAELFDYCNSDRIEAKLKVLLQMSLVLVWGTKMPVVRVGRIGGQYGKPRSKLTEVVEGYGNIHSFRGDNINGYDPSERTPDPKRLVEAYFHSAATINFIRSNLANGFASLHHPQSWDLSHVRQDKTRERYDQVVQEISQGLEFMKTVGADSAALNDVDLFFAHEAMLLEYEQCLTRKLKATKGGETSDPAKWYDTSAHFVWIGDRTRQLDGAHVEFFRGIANPIGIKVGPTMEADELVRILDILNPNYEVGKVTLITRYGRDQIERKLPGHITAVKATKHKVVWISDPCHGNTKTSPVTKLKTRYFDDIMHELKLAYSIHNENDNQLNGVHLELTGDAVTECIGGSENLEDEELSIRYQTVCDPRLSLSQSLDAAFLMADLIQPAKRGRTW